MAWLIALALFLWIGGGVCKLADRARDKQFRLQDDFDQKLTAIKANIYVLAWQECLNLQIDVTPLTWGAISLRPHLMTQHMTSIFSSRASIMQLTTSAVEDKTFSASRKKGQ